MVPPTIPPMGALRLATLCDVPRIATVATAGFFYSPVFSWERRFHREYPQDTFKSYEKMFADIIVSPDYVAMVVEDLYDPAEADKTGATLRGDMPKPRPGELVVAAAATWKLEPGSARRGQFVAPEDLGRSEHGFDGGLGRDKSPHHADMLDEQCDAAEDKYFKNHQLMDMVVTHPAYWRRGHGTALVKWGKALAQLDRVDQGVVAAEMGERLYLSLGYAKLDDVLAEEKDGDPPHDVRVGILRFSATGLEKTEL